MEYCPRDFDLEGYKGGYDWCMERYLKEGFNKACSNIALNCLNIGDESMSATQFCTTSKGDLPHLSHIFRNTELLGTEFNKVS